MKCVKILWKAAAAEDDKEKVTKYSENKKHTD